MGTDFKEVGGGPAVGVADDFAKLLRGAMFGNLGGQPGSGQRFDQANPVGSAEGIAGILQNLFSEGGGELGGSLGEMIKRENERNVGDIRARFGAGGGTSFGTPAAYGESMYRAEAAPRAATAVGQLQLSALLPLLQMAGGFAQKGVSQRETIAQPNALQSTLGILAPAAASFFGGPAGAALFGGGGAGLSGSEFGDILNQGGGIPDLSNIPAFSFA